MCLEWGSNPRLHRRIELKSTALDHSAIEAFLFVNVVFGKVCIFFCYKNKKNTSSGIRTRNPRIRSPMRYPLRHGGFTTLVGLEPTTARSEV